MIDNITYSATGQGSITPTSGAAVGGTFRRPRLGHTAPQVRPLI